MFNADVEFAMFMLAFLSSFFRWAFPMGQCAIHYQACGVNDKKLTIRIRWVQILSFRHGGVVDDFECECE